jgi:DNA-binding MarR family transcriptional regulator
MFLQSEAKLMAVLEKAHAVRIMVYLYRGEGRNGLSPIEMVPLLHLQAPQVYRAINFLIKLGLVKRQTRPIRVSPTRVRGLVFYILTQSGRVLASHLSTMLMHARYLNTETWTVKALD